MDQSGFLLPFHKKVGPNFAKKKGKIGFFLLKKIGLQKEIFTIFFGLIYHLKNINFLYLAVALGSLVLSMLEIQHLQTISGQSLCCIKDGHHNEIPHTVYGYIHDNDKSVKNLTQQF